jgi:hypothetical protein
MEHGSGGKSTPRKEKEASKTHSRTKDQIVRLSEQMIERANTFASMVKDTVFGESLPTVEALSKRGKR